MNVDRLNQWLTLGANFGVVIGLVLVAFQFQQNTDAVRLQARLGASASIQNAELSLAGDTLAEAYTKSILTPSELTPSEVTQVWGYLTSGLTGAYQNWVAYDAGYTTKRDMENVALAASMYLNYPFGLVYWNVMKNDQYDPEFVALVDGALTDAGPNSTQFSFLSLLDAKNELSDTQHVD
jgi:hypothetical protein